MRIKTRTRQLCNGEWVGEVKIGWLRRWRAVRKWGGHYYSILPGDTYYADCFVETEVEATESILAHLAFKGIDISQYPHPKQ